MISVREFVTKSADFDFQRNNMFSVVFATNPNTNSAKALNGMSGMTYEASPGYLDGATYGFNGGFNGGGVDPNVANDLSNMINNVIRVGTNRYLQNHDGTRKVLFGAMSSRLGQALIGSFDVGTYILDFFGDTRDNTVTYSPSLNVYATKIPENRISYEMDRNYNAPNIKITSRDYDPFVISFRMNPDGSNYIAMNDWVNAVDNPVNGKRALPSEVEANIQVTLHNRNGDAHTVAMINGAIPTSVGSPELSYESNNEISVFDVTFAYRYVEIGKIQS